MMPENKSILLFDGVCKFCHSSVQFVIKRDSGKNFLFCPLQSDKGKELLRAQGISDTGLTSMILLKDGKFYKKSSAALRIAKELRAPWPLLYIFILVPAFIRNAIYDFIGKRRYKWFGKYDSCWIPDDDSRGRFID